MADNALTPKDGYQALHIDATSYERGGSVTIEDETEISSTLCNLYAGKGIIRFLRTHNQQQILDEFKEVSKDKATTLSWIAKFTKSKEYTDWKLQCETIAMEFQNKSSYRYTTEFVNRKLFVDALKQILDDAYIHADLNDCLTVTRYIDENPQIEKFLTVPFFIPTEMIVDLAVCKPTSRAEDHSLELFVGYCKEVLKGMLRLDDKMKYIASIDCDGTPNEFGLWIKLRPHVEFTTFAHDHFGYNDIVQD